MAKPKIAAPGGALVPAAQIPAPEAAAASDQTLPDDAELAKTLPDVVDTPAPAPILVDQAPAVDALPDLVKARVLAASSYGQPNDVIEIDAELAKTLPDVVDTSPDAVAYAESLVDEQ